MYIHLSTSKGAGNNGSSTVSAWAVRIRTYPPREGPETYQLLDYGLQQTCIETYLLRKGPETFQRSWRSDHRLFCISTYLPSDGLETVLHHSCYRIMEYSYRYQSTSRVAGNPFKCLPASITRLAVCIATYLPREGPETFVQIAELLPFRLYSYLSTSRGVGNFLSNVFVPSMLFV